MRTKWAAAVRKRDGYECQACGRTTGLQVHHVLPVACFPQLRFIPHNGITLCKYHHTELHRALIDLILAPQCWQAYMLGKPIVDVLKASYQFKLLSQMSWSSQPAHELLRVVPKNPQKKLAEMYPEFQWPGRAA